MVIDVNVDAAIVTPVYIALPGEFQSPSRPDLVAALNAGIELVASGTHKWTARCQEGVGRLVESGALSAFDRVSVGANFEWADKVWISIGDVVDIGPEYFVQLATLDGIEVFLHLYATPRAPELTVAMCRNVNAALRCVAPSIVFNWRAAPTPDHPEDCTVLPVLVGGAIGGDRLSIEELHKMLFDALSYYQTTGSSPMVNLVGDPALRDSYVVSVDANKSRPGRTLPGNPNMAQCIRVTALA
jgi:hypothetical protein